jgi:hypothetical protein
MKEEYDVINKALTGLKEGLEVRNLSWSNR